jgi:hypothetical protein
MIHTRNPTTRSATAKQRGIEMTQMIGIPFDYREFLQDVSPRGLFVCVAQTVASPNEEPHPFDGPLVRLYAEGETMKECQDNFKALLADAAKGHTICIVWRPPTAYSRDKPFQVSCRASFA